MPLVKKSWAFFMFWITVFVFIAIRLAFYAGQWSISVKCKNDGGFKFGKREYWVVDTNSEKQNQVTRPEILQDDAYKKWLERHTSDSPFGKGVLGKIKAIRADVRRALQGQDNEADKAVIDRLFNSQPEKRLIQDSTVMRGCNLCGNKRCPKALNDMYRCTNSNAIGQTPTIDEDRFFKSRLDGSPLPCESEKDN